MTLKWLAVVVATVSLTLWATGNVVTLAVDGGQLPLLVNLFALITAGTAVVLAVVAELHERLEQPDQRAHRVPGGTAQRDREPHRRSQHRVRGGLPVEPRPGSGGGAVRPARTRSRRTLIAVPLERVRSARNEPPSPGYADARAAVESGQSAAENPVERRPGLADNRQPGGRDRALLRLRRHARARRRRSDRGAPGAQGAGRDRGARPGRAAGRDRLRPTRRVPPGPARRAHRRGPLRPLRAGAQPLRRRDRHRAGRAALGADHGRAGRPGPGGAAARHAGGVQAALRGAALAYRPAARPDGAAVGAGAGRPAGAAGRRPGGWCWSSSPRSTGTRAW